ncbi:MAG: hypothetical protein Hyperionvirus11_45 [Hyperionvirus sp.]|uniref:Sel1 repeat family protein n=1 Tax=Hyperionvirus sp. TaxID=2487770 RepID=A0A3G5A9L9_9VIRU|nr:MAG: hypothetical protein Hyperionvirus11_45 [Hyperionvirus sp.]
MVENLGTLVGVNILLVIAGDGDEVRELRRIMNGSSLEEDVRRKLFEYFMGCVGEKGMGYVEYFIGKMCMSGFGTEKNSVEELKWFRLSAEKGNSFGQYALGEIYFLGSSELERNYDEAVRLFRLSAGQKNCLGYNALGRMCVDGVGVGRDYSEALKWFGFSVLNGDSAGELSLARMCEEGLGMAEKDHLRAIELYRSAGMKGNDEALRILRIF